MTYTPSSSSGAELRGAPESVSSVGPPNALQDPLPKATPLDTARIVRDVQLPTVAKGPIIRRPKVVAAAERLRLEDRAVHRMQTVAQKYGKGPLMLAVPGKRMAVVLDPEHVHTTWRARLSPSPRQRLSSSTR